VLVGKFSSSVLAYCFRFRSSVRNEVTWQSKAKQSKAKQSKAKQSKAKQSKAL